MSESIQASWPSPAAPFEDHVAHLRKGIAVLNDQLILPLDRRFDVAYALLCTGRGTKSAVEVIGDPASGKTAAGDILLGPDRRVNIAPDDVSDTLFGYTNPINAEQQIPGKLVGFNDIDNPTLYLNEIGNLANVRPLLDIWDKKDIEDTAVYLTSNFPDGADYVHEHDDALKSRIALQLLAGDHDRDTTIEIQGYNAIRDKNIDAAPIVPNAAVRRSLQAGISLRYPVTKQSAKQLGTYVYDLINSMNTSGLTSYVSPTDARLGQALYDTARAGMLIRDVEYGTAIEALHIAQIASLVLPKMVKLSAVSREGFMEATGRRPSNIETAIGVRRVVARTAFETHFKSQVLTSADRTEMTDQSTDLFSYANPAGAGIGNSGLIVDIDQALYGKKTESSNKQKDRSSGRRNIFKRRG